MSRKPAAQLVDKAAGLLRLHRRESALRLGGPPAAAVASLLGAARTAILLAVAAVSPGHGSGRRAVELDALRMDADTARNILAFRRSKPLVGYFKPPGIAWKLFH